MAKKQKTKLSLPADYIERVYAGVLGKLIGVYLGRPFEQWKYERIVAELGEIEYYVHEKRGVPLVVTDDDITGTFTFLRALPDYGNTLDLTPAQIGQTWLNYIIEQRTILWWGGVGNSTEHTAYQRLKSGISAPQSGSIALNGTTVAEQIGAQIFIDGWAMVAPGNPELAADLARRAGSVSHDGESVYGAQVIASMESLAFVERDLNKLLDEAVRLIPRESQIYRLIADLREWRTQESDWHNTRARIYKEYGYECYPGNCHIVPNHAMVIFALLYGDDDFQKSMTIVNTSGYDTDCNSGNVGCLLGIKNGLVGIDAGPDWRTPIADRLYLPTADGGRAITDAVRETFHVVNIGRALAGEAELKPKNGARFHFELEGAVQGFQVDDSPECHHVLRLENAVGYSETGQRSLALRYQQLATGRLARVSTPTFIPPSALKMEGYKLFASPTLYMGQIVRARLTAGKANKTPVTCRLFVSVYDVENKLNRVYGEQKVISGGDAQIFEWQMPDTNGLPIAEIGFELSSAKRTDGTLYLDYLTWDGTPEVLFKRPAGAAIAGEPAWQRAWVDAVDQFDSRWQDAFRIVQNSGRGLISTGTGEWTDYRVSAAITTHLANALGVGACVQGLRRYYALLLVNPGKVRLVKTLDGDTILAETDFDWKLGETYGLMLEVEGTQLTAWIDGQYLFTVNDEARPLLGGGIALICEDGHLATDAVRVMGIEPLTT